MNVFAKTDFEDVYYYHKQERRAGLLVMKKERASKIPIDRFQHPRLIRGSPLSHVLSCSFGTMFAFYLDLIDTEPPISRVRPSIPATSVMEQLERPFHVVLVNPILFASIKFVKVVLTLDSCTTVTNIYNKKGVGKDLNFGESRCRQRFAASFRRSWVRHPSLCAPRSPHSAFA